MEKVYIRKPRQESCIDQKYDKISLLCGSPAGKLKVFAAGNKFHNKFNWFGCV